MIIIIAYYYKTFIEYIYYNLNKSYHHIYITIIAICGVIKLYL